MPAEAIMENVYGDAHMSSFVMLYRYIAAFCTQTDLEEWQCCVATYFRSV